MNKNKKITWFWEDAENQHKENEVNISVRIPGFRKEDIEMVASEDQIVIKAESKKEMTDRKEGYEKVGYVESEFYRTIPLPIGVDSENIKAKFENGLLKIMIPRKNNSKERTV